MNNVLDIEGYRFFQASYDEDETWQCFVCQLRQYGTKYHLFWLYLSFYRIGRMYVFFQLPLYVCTQTAEQINCFSYGSCNYEFGRQHDM